MKSSEERQSPAVGEAEFEEFLSGLSDLNISSSYWTDERGPWMMVTLRFFRIGRDGGEFATKALRLDFDSAGIRGGWSGCNLDGDVDVRAEDAEVDTSHPDGLRLAAADGSPAELAQAAADWFQRHWDEWERVRNLPPRRMPWLGRLLGQRE
jgi:hypothetical protein